MNKKIKVHIADDHKILIEGIVAIINTVEDIEIKGHSLTGKEVVDWFDIEENRVDVLILDITMPLFDGFQVLRHFKRNKIKQKVIILSSYNDAKIVEEVLDLGANGYLSKSSAGEHIIKAIKEVAEGGQYFSDDVKNNLFKLFTGQKNPNGLKPHSHQLEDPLTDREVDVLKLVAKEFSTVEIADFLNLSVNTVETYRKSLLKKIKVKNAVGLAMYAVKNNIVE